MGTETRERLLDEGLKLFLREGYTAIGIKRIVDAAGVPKGSFYHFFPGGKEDFAADVVDLYARNAARTRKELLADAAGSPLERLRGYFEHYARYFESIDFHEGCLLGNLGAEIADMSTEVRGRIAAAFRAWEEDIDRALQEAVDQGELGDVASTRTIARYLIHSWEGALLRMKVEKSSAAIDELIALIFDSWLTPAAKPKRGAGRRKKRSSKKA